MKPRFSLEPLDSDIRETRTRMIGLGLILLAYTGLFCSLFCLHYSLSAHVVIIAGEVWLAIAEVALALDYTRLVLYRHEIETSPIVIPAQRNGEES